MFKDKGNAKYNSFNLPLHVVIKYQVSFYAVNMERADTTLEFGRGRSVSVVYWELSLKFPFKQISNPEVNW